MTPEEITTALKEAAEAFPALGSRQPEDEDIVALREALVPLLLRIPFDTAAGAKAEKHNLSGLVQRPTVYAASRTDKQRFPPFVELDIYPDIKDDAKPNEVRKWEAIHRYKLADQARRIAAEAGLCDFIHHVVDETWYKTLRDPDDFYTKITAMEFLNHFENNSTELTETEAVKIPIQMMSLYKECDSIPQYLQEMEKAQRRSVRGKLPVLDPTLAATAINSLLATGDYKDDTTSWLKMDETQRTWKNFKKHFLAAYLAEEQRKKYYGGEQNPGQPFGGTATQQQSIPEDSSAAGGGITIHNAFPAQMSNSMDGFLDNIAALVSSDSEAMQKLVDAIATLTATNKKQAETITAQQKTIQSLSAGGAKPSNFVPHPGYEKGDGAYCWKHGYKLRKGHTGATCKHKDFLTQPDKRKATRSNNMGGCQDCKGWDE